MREVDEQGNVWEVDGNVRILPAENTTPEWRAQNQPSTEEQDLLDSLIPSQDEIDQAEFELKSINLLMELGVI